MRTSWLQLSHIQQIATLRWFVTQNCSLTSESDCKVGPHLPGTWDRHAGSEIFAFWAEHKDDSISACPVTEKESNSFTKFLNKLQFYTWIQKCPVLRFIQFWVKACKASVVNVLKSTSRIHFPMSPTLEIEFIHIIHSEKQTKKALPLLHMYHSRVLFLLVTASLREWKLAGLQLRKDQSKKKKGKKKRKNNARWLPLHSLGSEAADPTLQAQQIPCSFSSC